MTETTQPEPGNANATQRYVERQYVRELLRSCAPHQRTVLGILALAERYELDPAPMLSSLGTELPSAYRYQCHELAEGLATGIGADQALKEIPGLLPPSVVLALNLAREEGKLAAFYSSVLDRTAESDLEVSAEQTGFGDLLGLAFKTLTIAYFMMFILMKIVPEFFKMLQEFGVEAPRPMFLLMWACDRMASFWFVGALLLPLLVPFFFPSFRMYLRRWNPFTWRQPEFVPVSERRYALAIATQSDSRPSALLARLLDFPGIRQLFIGLKKAQIGVENEDDEWKSIAKAKIISQQEAQALALASSGETRAWLLNWSASRQHHRWANGIANRNRAAVTLVNIGLMVLVALAAVAVFSTLIVIMNSLHGNVR